MPDDSLPGKGPGRSKDGNSILTEFKVSADNQPVKFRRTSADFEQKGWPVAAAIDGKPQTGWAFAPQFGKAHHATFIASEPLGLDEETTLAFRLEQQNNEWAKHTIGRLDRKSTRLNSSH